MSYEDPNDDQNKSQVDQALSPSGGTQAPAAPADTQPTGSQGGGGVVSGGSTGASAPTPATDAKPSSSGSWTNLQSYLDANADQGATVGNQIAKSVDDQGAKAQDAVTNLGVNFKSAVDANTVNQDPAAVSGVLKAATSATAQQGLTDDQLAAWNKQAGAQYTGPTDETSFGGYSQTQQAINDAQTTAAQTQSESGRNVLLNKQYQGASANGYSQGENNLDQLLLQNSAGGQAALQPLAQKWGALNGALSNSVATGNAAAQNAMTVDQATAEAAKGALSKTSSAFKDQLNTGLAALQKQNTDAYNQVLAHLKSGDLTSSDYAALGFTPSTQPVHIYGGTDANGNVVGTHADTYLTPGTAPTLQSYASADQYAQAAALAKLAGQSSSDILSPAGLAQAGTAATTPAFGFNTSQFSSDNNSSKALYDSSVDQIRSGPTGWSSAPSVGATAPGSINSQIPAQLTNRRDLSSATPQELVDFWIPLFQEAQSKWGSGYGGIANQLMGAVQKVNVIQQEYGLPTYQLPGQAPAVRPPLGK